MCFSWDRSCFPDLKIMIRCFCVKNSNLGEKSHTKNCGFWFFPLTLSLNSGMFLGKNPQFFHEKFALERIKINMYHFAFVCLDTCNKLLLSSEKVSRHIFVF